MAAVSGEVVALRALGLGDLLTAVPALRGLRRHFDSSRITLITAPALRPLVERERLADRVLPLSAVRELPEQLPDGVRGHVDAGAVAVNLHGAGPQSTRLLESLEPERLIGACESREHEPEVHRLARLLDRHGIDCDPADQRIGPAARRDSDYVVVHPGAASAARRWPAARWAAVAAELARRGLDVRVTAGPDERSLARLVAATARSERCEIWSGDVAELADLVHGARLVVSGDTGVAHLAYATGTPSVTLFGPTPPARWGPTIDHSIHLAIWHGASGDPHAGEPFSGLTEITADEALASVGELLGRRAA